MEVEEVEANAKMCLYNGKPALVVYVAENQVVVTLGTEDGLTIDTYESQIGQGASFSDPVIVPEWVVTQMIGVETIIRSLDECQDPEEDKVRQRAAVESLVSILDEHPEIENIKNKLREAHKSL